MFFIIGISSGSRQLDYLHRVFCPFCGRDSAVTVYMVYQAFTVFFIPIFKFNRRYIVSFQCCGRNCGLNSVTGESIARGEDVLINPQDLDMNSSYCTSSDPCYNNSGSSYDTEGRAALLPGICGPEARKQAAEEYAGSGEQNGAGPSDEPGPGEEFPVYCGSCGKRVDRSDDFCPHCGARL